MKKKIILMFFVFVMFILCINIESFAVFEINNFVIDAKLNSNGNLYVTEEITYYTDESTNGLTRNILIKNPRNEKNSADNFELYSVSVDNEYYKQVYFAEIGDDGVFEYTPSNAGKYNIKVYSPFYDNYKVVKYEYLLKNVAIKYNDIGELYWNFIGNEWDCNIKHLTINIELPEVAAYETSWVFGHGSDNGNFTKNENYITLTVDDIEAYQPIDARILFSRDAISDSNKVINQNVLDKYINEEEGLSSKMDEKTIIGNLTVKDLAIILSGIIIVLGIGCYILFDKEVKVEKNKYIKEIPFGLPPELLQYIYYGKIKSDSFYIAVLNLVKLGVYKLENTVNKVGKETQKIIYNFDHNANLKEYQKNIVNTINKFLEEKDGELSLDFIKLSSKMERSNGSGFKKYKDELETEKESLVGKPVKIPKKIIGFATLIMTCLIAIIMVVAIAMGTTDTIMPLLVMLIFLTVIYSFIFASAGAAIPVLIFLIFHCGCFQGAIIGLMISCGIGYLYIPYILMFILIQYLFRVKKFPKEERQIVEQIAGLRRYIKDYSLLKDKDSLEYIELWEDYFIMAIALGLNKKTINYFYNYGKEQNSNLGYSIKRTSSYMHFHYGMYNSFYNYQKSYEITSSRGSRYSGSSGGFSGGSSSGGGGGRRRWRKSFLKYKNIVFLILYINKIRNFLFIN